MTLDERPCQECDKPVDHTLPVNGGHVGPCLLPYHSQRLWRTSELHCRVNKGLWLSIGHQHACLAMRHVHVGGGIVKGDHCQTAGHGFQRHVAECFRFAGEQKHICRGIVLGELLTCLDPTEDEIRMGFLQGSTQWPIPYYDTPHSSPALLHGAVRRDGEP